MSVNWIAKKREAVIVVAAAAVMATAASVAGCSSDNKGSTPSSSPASSSSSPAATTSSPAASSSTPAAGGETKVTVGGKPQNVSGPVDCSTTNGKFSISVGDMLTGIIIGLEQDASVVHNAGLGTVDGVVMSFTEGAPGNTATATKTDKTYKITGNATGQDTAGQPVSKPFEVEVTCP